jgi:hypothetical protein
MVKRVIIHHHLGIGDHFTCNALVHYLSKDYDEVWLACKGYTEATVKHLYEDYPKIKPFVIQREPEDVYDFSTLSEIPIIRIGFEYTNPNEFERSFYSQFGLPLEYKNDNFRLPLLLNKSKEFYDKVVDELSEDYIFIHDESTAGSFSLKIQSKLNRFFVKKEDTPDVLDYVHTICNAKEIHFINSGIFPLVVLLDHMGLIETKKIFYHNKRKFHEGGLKIELPAHYIEIPY